MKFVCVVLPSYSLRTTWVTEQLTPYHGVNDLTIINIHNLIKKHIPFVLCIYYTYLYPMKNGIEVLVVLGTFLFGMAVGKWMNSFTPSFTKEDDIEMVIQDDDVN